MNFRESDLTLATLGLSLAGLAAAGVHGGRSWEDDLFEEEDNRHEVYGRLCTAAEGLTSALVSLYPDPWVSFYQIPEGTGDKGGRLERKAQSAALERFDLKRKDQAFYLEKMEVSGRHRKKGLGRGAFERAEEFALASGAKAIFLHAGRLESSPRSPHPVAFWEKMGFKSLVSKPGTLDAVMVKTLF